MSTVAAMHEHVHQRTGQQNQKRQRTEYMGSVFGDEVEARNGKKCQ